MHIGRYSFFSTGRGKREMVMSNDVVEACWYHNAARAHATTMELPQLILIPVSYIPQLL